MARRRKNPNPPKGLPVLDRLITAKTGDLAEATGLAESTIRQGVRAGTVPQPDPPYKPKDSHSWNARRTDVRDYVKNKVEIYFKHYGRK